MRLKAVPETWLERVGLALGLGPLPLADTLIAMLLSRVIMVGTRVGVFEALADGARSTEEVAAACGTSPGATRQLLFALAAADYLKAKENDRWALVPMARRWLLKRSRHSLRDAVIHRFLDADMLAHSEAYVRTGEPTRFHETMSEEQWDIYQRGQRAHASYSAQELVHHMPIPRGARQMLDIGGSHGLYSVALCRKHRRLRSTILDLPAAVAKAAPLLAEEGMGDRVVHQPGSVLTADLGEHRYDVILTANILHHFDDATNRAILKRIARALKPGGYSVIYEILRARTPEEAGQIGGLLDFYFALCSESGTWSAEEMASWQDAAGLAPRRVQRMLTAPGYGLQIARK
ncbi:MAG: class I SAM-dependent methyltransferase [Candidatus Xenobia bacterium]